MVSVQSNRGGRAAFMEGAPMLDTTTFIGLDVHARSIKAVSLDVMTGEVRAATFGYDAGAVAEWVRSIPWTPGPGACTSPGSRASTCRRGFPAWGSTAWSAPSRR